MKRNEIILLIVICIFVNWANAALIQRSRRQTYYYSDDLRNHAQMHSGTKVIYATSGRYAPQDWPAWYTRTIFKWDGDTRRTPYHSNNARFTAHEQTRLRNVNKL